MAWELMGGRRLLLAGAGLGWFWLGAGALALVLLLVLYREERKLVSRRSGLGLLGLRLAAAAVLVLSLFEPIASRSYREAVKGRVVVAVDVSESMETADPGRPEAHRARLSKALGLSPGEALDRLPRREVARRLLDGRSSPVGKVAGEHRVEAVAFARDTAPATLAGLAESLKRPGKADDPGLRTTDWQPALASALTESDAPVLGVVLLTDGRQNAPGDPFPTVDRLSARGIPVYPILIGSTTPPRDVAIARLKGPEGVYKGDVANVETTLKIDGYDGRDVAVTLERPGYPPLRETVHASDGGSRPTVTFRVPMEAVGAQTLTVDVEAPEGDVRPDNNRGTVTIQVADDKARVLLVDGEARWEFRYLRNALARDPRMKVEAVVFHQPEPTGISAERTYGDALPPRPDDPKGSSADPLGGFDAIAIGDVDPADLTADAWLRLESYVADRGGTLVIAPGPRFWSALTTIETARKLVPVLLPQPLAIDTAAIDPAHPSLPPGVAVVPDARAVADANAWPMLQLAAAPEQNRAAWEGLPRLPWVLAGKAKPGASVLANARDDATAAIAAQPYGLGKVLWVGTDGTWRWRHRVGDTYHHRFWGQVMRWSAAGKLMAGNSHVRFGPARPRVPEGEGARLQARIAEGIAGVGPDLLIAARVFKAGPTPNTTIGDAIAVVPLRALAGQPRTYDGVAPSLPIGSYVIRLDVPELAGPLHLDGADVGNVPGATLDVTPRDTTERVELAATRDPLDRLAAATGGRVFRDDESDALPPLLRSRTKEAVRTEETPLWDHPATLVLFFAILTVEWVWRKRLGLP